MKITVRSALSSLVLGGIVATSIAPAFADDEFKIVDVNYPMVVVQYKVSGDDSIGDATSGETKTLKKGETWAIPVAGERVFWHREANPEAVTASGPPGCSSAPMRVRLRPRRSDRHLRLAAL